MPVLLFNFNNRGRGKLTVCKICKLQFKIETLLFSEHSPFSTFKSVGILCSLHVVCSSIRGHCISDAVGQAVCNLVLMLGGCGRRAFSVCVFLMSEKRERENLQETNRHLAVSFEYRCIFWKNVCSLLLCFQQAVGRTYYKLNTLGAMWSLKYLQDATLAHRTNYGNTESAP